MQKQEIIVVNGIVLTPQIINELARFQTDGLLGNPYIEKLEYNNAGLDFYIENLNEAILFIVNEILLDDDREKEKVNALRGIASTRDSLLSFKLPDDFKINL